FSRTRTEAIAAAAEGRSIPLAAQFEAASHRAGRHPRAIAYAEAIRRLVARTPFRRAPQVLPTLQELRRRGYRVGVISNTIGEPGWTLRPVLRQLGFDPLVEAWAFSDEHAWTKPSPALFRWALEALRTSPERAVHVGDGWVDIEGARRAGMRAGILFTGLQAYGESYRQYLQAPGHRTPTGGIRLSRLEELPSRVATFLPLRPPRTSGGAPLGPGARGCARRTLGRVRGNIISPVASSSNEELRA
ncbi:MAG: HAD-IA family hydrolase, partial [Thermoplasmata archaeon]|nr:HAD-IA family hydrolase [Thermoplasmata archaeon]